MLFITQDPDDKAVFGYVCIQPNHTEYIYKLYAFRSEEVSETKGALCLFSWKLGINVAHLFMDKFSLRILSYLKKSNMQDQALQPIRFVLLEPIKVA